MVGFSYSDKENLEIIATQTSISQVHLEIIAKGMLELTQAITKMNKNIERIADELSFKNDMEYPKTRSEKGPLDNY